MSDKRLTEQGMTEEDARGRLHEDLSAFLDGELDAERTRFLLQRLGHDADLRGCWERWQLASSSMRRQAQPLPADFADRVLRALDADSGAVAPQRSRALRWAGGAALAASLSVAGVFVFDAMHQPRASMQPVAAAHLELDPISPIQRTALALPEPVIKLPIPVKSGVVTAFRSPLRPVLLRQPSQRPTFSPFPQPYPIDPELEAYLQQQKSGAGRDVFTQNPVNLPDSGDSAVRRVAWPQDGQH